MKNFYILLITLTFSLTGFGQINEGFEIGMPTSYTSGNITLSSGTWTATQVIRGTTGVNSGSYSCQIRSVTASQITSPTLTGGVGTISFYVTASTTSGAYQVNISTDNGSTFSPAPGSPFTVSTTKTLRTIVIDNPDVNKIQIYRTGATIYIDDFETTLPTPSCTTATLPFAEGFEDGSVPPNCWDSFDNSVGTGQSWEIEDGSNYPAQSGTFSAKINPEFLASGTSEDWLVTPAIDLSPTTGNQLTFWGRRIFNTISGTNDYAVKISTTSQTDTGSFTDLQTYAATDFGMSFSQKTIDLSAYDGQTVYIAFVYTQNDGVGWIVDTINIEGTCDAPNTQASGYNTTGIDAFAGTATLNWTRGDGDNVLVVMREGSAVNANPVSGTSYTADAVFSDGDEIGSGNFVVYNGNSTSVNVSGLNMSSTYHVAFYEYNTTENCYNTDSPATGNFTVPCETFSLPFTEGFEDGAIPACWATYRGTNGLGTINDWTINGDANTGAFAAYVEYENVSGGNAEDWLVTPAINIPNNAITQLSFYTKDEYSSSHNTNYTIRVSTTSQTDHASFTTVETYTEAELGNIYNQKLVDLNAYNGQTVYIAFVMSQDDGDSWFVDDIVVESEPEPNDQDTQVYEASIQIPAATLNPFDMLHDELAVDVFGFVIEDIGGNDGLPTNVTTMRFVPGPNNTADWSDIMQGVTITDGNSVSYTPTSTTINDNEIIVTFATPIVIPDMDYLEFTLGMYLNPSPVVDHSIVQFQINAINSGFVADANGSGFDNTFLDGDVVGNNMTLDVEATTVHFQQQPTDTYINAAMSPAVTVAGTDDFGNIDIDYDGFEIEITSEGALDGGSVTATTVNGIATFANIVHTAPGTFLRLTASGENLYMNDMESDPFDIWDIPVLGWQIIATDQLFTIDFDNTVNGVNEGAFNGTGFTATPTSGQLDSDAWASTGMSDGTLAFGGSMTSGDYAKETSTGGVVQGGFYAFEVASGNYALGVQPTGSDFNPGTITLRSQNQIGTTLTSAMVDYTVYVYNDSPRSNSFNFSYSDDDSSYTPVTTLNLSSPATSSGTQWTAYRRSVLITGLNIAHEDFFYMQWNSADIGGTGTRDEFAIDDIQVVFNPSSVSFDASGDYVDVINDGATMHVAKDANLLTGSLTNNGVITLQSDSDEYSSLIATSVTGTVSYDRHVNTGAVNGEGGNDLIASPLAGQNFGDFAADNGNIITDPNDATRKLFGPFDKVTGAFLIYETDTNASTPLVSGEGYRAASTDGNGFTFTGTVNTGNVNRTIEYSGGAIPFREWNLVGNPYPSYIKLSDFLAANSSSFNTNSAGVYGYDDSASNYTIWNEAYALANPNALIAPGQGFFVAAQTSGGSIAFTPAMRATGNSDDFIPGRSANIAHLKLNAAIDNKNYNTDFYFLDQASRNLDPGFDASVFGKVAPSTALYSQLVEGNTGIDMAVQSLAYSDLGSDVIIPLGINVAAGKTAHLNIASSTLPEGTNVYLEDSANNTFTLLNSGTFTFTANETLTDTGRFYLRFTNETLSATSQTLEQLSIFTTFNPRTLFVKGIVAQGTSLAIYDLQGRLVLATELDSSSRNNTVNVNGISDGIYVVKVRNAEQQKTQRVIIR